MGYFYSYAKYGNETVAVSLVHQNIFFLTSLLAMLDEKT